MTAEGDSGPVGAREPSGPVQLSFAQRLLAHRAMDWSIALALAGGYMAALLLTVADLGYARDEGFYFGAGKSYARWIDLLFTDFDRAMLRSSVDRYWGNNHEHPAFIKTLFALSYKYLYLKWHWFSEEGTAFRFPAMVMSAASVSITYLWGSRAISRTAGLFAAASFALIPRVFYHSHLDCFDMPVLSMWLLTSYVYWRSTVGGGLPWALLAGVLYGFFLNTKHNSWLFPGVLIVHWLVMRGPRVGRNLKVGHARVPLALFTMAIIGPVVFYLTWPWIWFDTGNRLAEYVAFHTGHVFYNMEFLGETFFRPPMPRLYAWLMTAGTVPAITLGLFLLGSYRALKEAYFDVGAGVFARFRSRRALGSDARRHKSARSFWLLCVLVSYAPWISSNSPIFGGTKHWITAYPFVCLLGGLGFDWVLREIRSLSSAPWLGRIAAPAMTLSCLVGPLAMTQNSHPWGLSCYTPLVGGAPGAATLGLNRTFWGYATGSVQDFINDKAPPRARAFVHDTALQSWDMMVKDGRLRKGMHRQLGVAGSNIAVYHHEPHMLQVDYQIWTDYGVVAPGHVGHHNGVPIVWVYTRP